jgi:hypothetical protein
MPSPSYDPWRDLAENWPHYRVQVEPMYGDLLGEIRGGGVIALRARTSSGQRRCTLTHEIVHLERGIRDCGPWHDREEAAIEAEVGRRLVPLGLLAAALRTLGGDADRAALAQLLDVDRQTLDLRLHRLTSEDRRRVRTLSGDHAELWRIA